MINKENNEIYNFNHFSSKFNNNYSATKSNLSYNIDLPLDTRMMKFVHSCVNQCNSVCKSLLSAKLLCIKSTFAVNYKHLSHKYKICQDVNGHESP